MGVQWVFRPPAVNAAVLLHAAKPVAERAGAEILLNASQPLVPVDQGDLKASGHIDDSGVGASVVYDATSPEGFPYGIKQHEDLKLHHPHGGQAKFLEQPMHSEAPAVATAMAVILREALR